MLHRGEEHADDTRLRRFRRQGASPARITGQQVKEDCAVATALAIPVRAGTVRAEADLDFRGTLGVSKEAPVGLQAIRLHFDLDTEATPDQLASLLKLTERYCVIYQTLKTPGQLSVTHSTR